MTDSEHMIAAVIPTASHFAKPPVDGRFRNKNPSIFNKCYELQELILRDAKTSKGAALGQLAKAFVSLESLKLRIRMKPAPKPIDVQDPRKSKAKSSRSSFSEGPEPGKAPLVVPPVPVQEPTK